MMNIFTHYTAVIKETWITVGPDAKFALLKNKA